MLATRITGAMVALVLFTVLAIGSIAYYSVRSSMLPFEFERARTSVTRQAALIETTIKITRDDTIIVSRLPAVREFYHARDPEDGVTTVESAQVWGDRVAGLFASQMNVRKEYLQMRLLDAAGRELIRIDRKKGVEYPVRIPEAELQEKGKAEYFLEASKLPEGQVYLSPINLNREHYVIEVPHVPVLRTAMPIRDGKGRLQGIVVINLDLRNLFAVVKTNTLAPYETYLVNAKGDFLVHPDSAMTFGFDLGTPHQLQDQAPSLQAVMGNSTVSVNDITEMGTEYCYAMAPVRFEDRQIIAWLVRRAPVEALLASSNSVLKSAALGGLGALVCGILLAVALAYSLTKPLNRLTLAIQKFASGDPTASSVIASGEIGILSRAFSQMRTDIQVKTEALQYEIEAKTRAMEEANRLAETERLYSAVVSSTDDAVVTKDLNRVITGWNKAAERLFGYTAAEAIGQKIDLIVPEERRPELDMILSKLKAGERVEHFDTVRRAKDGRLVEVSLTISPLRDKHGQVVGASKIVRDISERRMAEARFQLAVEACPSGMVMIDQQGKIVLVNRETERMFGYDREELLGKMIEVLVPERFREQHPAYRAEYLVDPEARKMGVGRELKAVRKDGSEFPVEIGLNPIVSKGEHYVLAAVLDITERLKAIQVIKQANMELERRVTERTKELQESTEALQRSNEELSQFAYVASHDLQEPLRAVAGCVDLLAMKYKGRLDGSADELIKHIVDGATRMRQQIQDLLALSRVGTRGKPPERVKVEEIVEEVKGMLSVAIDESKAQVVCGPLPEVMADRSQIQQLLQNLVANGIKFCRDRAPVVRIFGEIEGDSCRFCVADNGIGIDPKYFGRLFAIFQRLHTRAEYPGTGIGLAICKKIVQRHGGRIWIESSPGNGTQFYFTLPRA